MKLHLFRSGGMLAACAFYAALASAFTLGELRSASRQGERLHAEIDVIAPADERPEAGCVHLRKPAGDESTPWLRDGALSIRREGGTVLLDVRSLDYLRAPALRIGLTVGCGHGFQRDYLVTLRPAANRPESPVVSVVTVQQPSAEATAGSPRPVRETAAAGALRPRDARAPQVNPAGRLVLAGAPGVDAPALRLASELESWRDDDARAGERDLLRMEFRVLQALHEQAASQLDAAGKQRELEAYLKDQRREGDAPVASASAATLAPAMAASPLATPVAVQKPGGAPEWMPYGLAVAALLAAWALVRYGSRRRATAARVAAARKLATQPRQPDLADEFDDFDARPPSRVAPRPVPTPPAENPLPVLTTEVSPPTRPFDAARQYGETGTTVDEHYALNPVLELADIMLSFGRVKGAAQALQDYIDQNPDEALQPWIRLMDVYRMAGMRNEFERVAADLNQHFNVEIQLWNEVPGEASADVEAVVPAEPLPIQWPDGARKARSIEEMEHVLARILATWPSQACADYLNELLRDNRGGLRTGLSLPVVAEIMFLIELQQAVANPAAEGVPPA